MRFLFRFRILIDDESFNFNTIPKAESMDKIELLSDKEIRAELVKIAEHVYNPANSFAQLDWVKRILKFMEFVKPATYHRLWRSIWLHDASETIVSGLEPIDMRLEKLAIRLQDEGLYTDSEICWQALEKIKKAS